MARVVRSGPVDAVLDEARRLLMTELIHHVEERCLLLGEERALSGGSDPDTTKEATEMASQRAELAAKLDELLKHQQTARRAEQTEAMRDSHELAWRDYPSKSEWILAYYAEDSGDMVTREIFRACSECEGKGVVEVRFGGGAVLQKCARCRHVGVDRIVRYR